MDVNYEAFEIELDGVEKTIASITYDYYIIGYTKHLKKYYYNKNYRMLKYVVKKLLSWFDTINFKNTSEEITPYIKTKEILKGLYNLTIKADR